MLCCNIALHGPHVLHDIVDPITSLVGNWWRALCSDGHLERGWISSSVRLQHDQRRIFDALHRVL